MTDTCHERMRAAWEAGFTLCRSYGDNHVHFDGEQKEAHWRVYLAAVARSSDPSPRCNRCGYVMCQEFDYKHVNGYQTLAIPSGKYSCTFCKSTAAEKALSKL